MSQEPSPDAPVPPMPPGIHKAYIFDFFNTTSWTVVLSTPMLLFFQQYRATATILAVAVCLAPLLNILQMPAARFVERVGYRRFVLSGWTIRSFVVIAMALVAFLPPSFDRATRIVLMLGLTFIYNALRGISVCGMLPWFTHIVPEERRGEFLSKDQISIGIASIVSLCLYGLILRGGQTWYSFGVVFSISVIAAFVSLYFLKQIPDVPVEKISSNPEALPWREMILYPPFFKYLQYNVVINLALGASNAFWVRYFQVFLHVSQSKTLFVACICNMILAGTLFLIAPMVDRAGNKLVLALAGIFFICHFGGWACIAGGVLPFNHLVLGLQCISAGISGALWNLANVRYVMGIIPAMGRPHFLAIYSVASNLTLGLVPLFWGPILDIFERWHSTWGFWNWNIYSLLYCSLVATIVVGMVMGRTLVESESMTWDVFMRELLVKTPSRAVSRLIGRLRPTGF